MRKTILVFVAAVWAIAAGAQGISRVREELARPGFGSAARVVVREQGDAAQAVFNADYSTPRTTVMTYGVSLFRDNSQNAGENARAVAAQFAAGRPEITVTVSYESPYFRVEAGNFIDRTDAVALAGQVLAQFPKAVVVQSELTLEELRARWRVPEPEVAESGSE